MDTRPSRDQLSSSKLTALASTALDAGRTEG